MHHTTPASRSILGEESAARHGVGVVPWAAQREIAQALAGELIAQEAGRLFCHRTLVARMMRPPLCFRFGSRATVLGLSRLMSVLRLADASLRISELRVWTITRLCAAGAASGASSHNGASPADSLVQILVLSRPPEALYRY
jgi:hypothetical protein